MAMSIKSVKSKSRPTTAGTVLGEETSSTRKRIQEVLGQARAALRQSQQFRPTVDKKNNNLSSRLTFQQQKQEDYWSSENAGEVIVEETVNPLYEGSRPPSKSVGRTKSFFDQDDDFGLPFRDAQKRTLGPKQLGSTREQQKKEFARRDDNSSDSSSSIGTTDLKVSSDESDERSSVVTSAVGTAVSYTARSKASKLSKEVRIIEPPHTLKYMGVGGEVSASEIATAAITMVPSTMKLTPLEGYPVQEDDDYDDGNDNDDDGGVERPVSAPKHTTSVSVKADDLGFSRALVKKSIDDPHWFEKALLVRGEPISEAAYKAFKKAHEIQEEIKKKGESILMLAPARSLPEAESMASGAALKDPKEPEFTADWISDDAGSYFSDPDVLTSIQEDIVSVPEFASGIEERLSTIQDSARDDEDKTLVDEANTESIIRTATELEASGVIGEITSNLQNVLDISDKPASQDFSRMSPEERRFASEYDEAMKDKHEPLGSIFHTVYGDDEDLGDRSKDDTEDRISKSLGLSDREEEFDEEEEEGHYENTFMSNSSSVSQKTVSSKSSTKQTPTTSKRSLTKPKFSTSGATSTSTSRVDRDKRSTKEKAVLETRTKSRVNADVSNNNTLSSSSQQKSVSFSSSATKKSRSDSTKSSSKTSDTKTSRKTPSSRKPPSSQPVPVPLDPPTNRYQKNIQTILEKEVYQKELKRQRSKRIREEKNQERLQIIAAQSIERNKNSAWKDPDTTEILLPELFKYKSMSGLQAAKAKKSTNFKSQPGVNYGAPYFQLNGSVEAENGAAQLLAKAQVESLDIPDLVREVLASNERMYRMTVEASREMNKIYKDKIDKILK